MALITPQEFLELVDKRWNFVTQDEDGTIKLWIERPAVYRNEKNLCV
jgi:hypothetical protein